MIKLFLKAKHWQLFLLVCGIPIILQLIVMNSLFDPNKSYFVVSYFYKWFLIIILLFISVIFSWFWSVVIGLQSKITESAKPKLTRFKILFFIPLIYMLFIFVYMYMKIAGIVTPTESLTPGMISLITIMVVLLHLFSMFCIFHTIFHVAKTIKTVELQKKLKFSDFSAEFIIIWFFPIGIWIIQPKVNMMIKD